MSIHSDIHVISGNPSWMVAEIVPKIIFKKEKEEKIYSLPRLGAYF